MNKLSLNGFAFNRLTKARILALAFFAALLCSSASHAFMWRPSQLQYALMPDHCKARLSAGYGPNRSEERDIALPMSEGEIGYWKNKVGPVWQHMHHYCGGLGWLMLAESPTMQERQGHNSAWAYRRADAEIAYTIGRSNPSSPIWIEMNIAQARARAGLQNYDKAVSQLVQLLNGNPSRGEIYVALAKTLMLAGKKEDAIATLETGLGRVSKKGPLLFYLARYYYDVGNIQRSAELTLQAEAAGMKMDSLRERLGTSAFSPPDAVSPASGTPTESQR